MSTVCVCVYAHCTGTFNKIKVVFGNQSKPKERVETKK